MGEEQSTNFDLCANARIGRGSERKKIPCVLREAFRSRNWYIGMHITSMMTTANFVKLWVFNPDIKYSSSKVDHGHPRRAMKVLYEKVKNPSKIADEFQLAVEDLPLPPDILDELEKDLETTYLNLPEPARKFLPGSTMGKWKVSLLDRFDDSSTASIT